MNNKRKERNVLKHLLATASAFSVIVAGSSTAFGFAGAVPHGKITADHDVNVDAIAADNKWREVDAAGVPNGAAFADGPADGSAITFGRANDILNINAPRRIQALNVGNKAGTVVNLNSDFVLGSVVGANTTNFVFDAVNVNPLSFTLNGAPTIAADHGFVANANDYAAVGEIDFAAPAGTPAATRTLIITPDATAAPAHITFANAKIANGENAIVNVTSYNGFNVIFNQASMSTARTINISNNSNLEFYTGESVVNGGTLHLQHLANDSINFLGDDSKLVLTSRAAVNKAHDFKVMTGSLGGANDGRGIISFNTATVAGILSNDDANGSVIGIDRNHRAKQFLVTTNGANVATIDGKVFTKDLQLTGDLANGGHIVFNKAVYVGNDGKTDINTATQVSFNDHADVGTLDFKNIASAINVAANKTLTGNFLGNRAVPGGASVGEIHFAGAGEFNGSATKLALIDITGAGVLKFSKGVNSVAQVKAMAAGAHFEFADGYELTGNINGNGAGAPNLDFKGDAKITGGIGNTDAVGNISIAAGKTLTVNSAVINAAKIFGTAAGQGTLALTHRAAANVIITSRISENGGGTIDATNMADRGVLTIVGNIGTDPAVDNAKALDKILLKKQNLALTPTNFANIAAVDFNKEVSTVTFTTLAVNYALGELSNAENAKFNIDRNITLYNTRTNGGEKLQEINFVTDDTLTLGKDNNIAADGIITKTHNTGALVFAGNSTLKGQIGTELKKLKAITIGAGVTATTSGIAFVAGDVTFTDEKSVLVVDDNYTVNQVVGGGALTGAGTLRFVNKNLATLKTTSPAPAPGVFVPALNAVEALELAGGDVELANNGHVGIDFKKIVFTDTASASTVNVATAPTLILDRKLDGMDVESSFNSTTGRKPVIKLVKGAANTIDAANHIGTDKEHLINLQFTGDDSIIFRNKKLFASVTTTVNNTGTAEFDADANVVYGLGSKNLNLKEVKFNKNTKNFGDTYVKMGAVQDGATYSAGGTIAGGDIQLGNARGSANAHLADNVILESNITSVGTDNRVGFQGNAVIKGKMGASGNNLKEITFIGNKDHIAELCNDMNSEVVNFGSENIKIGADKVVIAGGVSNFDGNINLQSNKLVLKSTGTWGADTTIDTTFTKDGILGSIELAEDTVVTKDVGVTVHVIDEAYLNEHNDLKHTFIAGNDYLKMRNGEVKSTILGITSDQVYAEWIMTVEDGKRVFRRKDVSSKVSVDDLKKVDGDDIDKKNSELIFDAKYGDAQEVAKDIGHILDPEKRGNALKDISNVNTNPQVTEVIADTASHVNKVLTGRMAAISVADQARSIASGSDDGSASMGAWVMPYYSQATQKNKGGVAGYTSRSGGGVFGFDTLANENLTIGAAVSIVKTNMKHKGYKTGKTTIDTLMGSIYGSQQLAKDFFIQAVASFGSSKIKGTDPRIVSKRINANGQETAKSSYGSMSYGGEVLFGYNAKVAESVLLTPMAGISYTKFSDESYKETGTTHRNRLVSKKASSKIEAIVGARVSSSIDANGIAMIPEAHAFVSQKLGGKSGKVDARLDGMTSPFVTRTDKAAKTSYNVGVSVSAKAGTMEYGAGYDAYLANKYVGHQGTLKVRVNF
ncbi:MULTISPECIES: autotransporter outer membrane beta-barrel domain-containing protein [unclassified Candidatus Tisiphia]|uniref:autotransporter outer membrane beta-barrel domain-containing protein n=1 Tax=unclassified Candidatus Tisiphia TaxID=2996318 RepID=UPI00312C9331